MDMVAQVLIFRMTRRQALLAVLSLMALMALMLLLSPKASAMSASDIPASVAPLSVRQDVANHCNPPTSWTSYMSEWISAPSSPTATSINVPYGTTSVRLQLNYLTYRCIANIRPSTQGASLKVNDTNPNIPSLIGRVDDLPFVSNSTTGYRSAAITTFNYTVASPGLISDQDVVITMTSQGTLTKNGPIYGVGSGDSSYNCNSTYSSCDYCALVGSEYQHPTSSPHNFDPAPGYCKNGPGYFRIRVNVVEPATLDGVKIDDSKSGPYGGDDTNDAYQTLRVSVSSVGSDPGNPFYFDASGRGSKPIPVGSAGTTRTVSISLSGLGGGWQLVGHSICDGTAVSDCTTATVEFGGKYYTASGATSFSYNFKPGHHYHMRWIFKDLIDPTCGSLGLDPATVDMTTKFNVHPTINIGTTAYKPTGGKMTLTIDSAMSGATWSYGPKTVAAPVDSTGTAGASFNNLGPITAPGDYTATWVYSADGSIGIVCTEQIPVVNMPYLTVYGGDTMVGAAATTQPGTCYNGSNDAGAYSWNNHGDGYLGAGSQYAVMAMGQIQDFASNLGGNGGPQDPKKLSFANNVGSTINVPGGLYGGKFGGTVATCDLVSDLTDVTEISGASASSQLSSSKTIPKGTSDVMYVNGDVHIGGDIKYAPGWGKLSDIPSFKLIVRGNIYIDSGVKQLDGIYAALPDTTGNGGVIYTCATGAGAVKPTDSNFFNACDTQLVINGAFAAKQVQFLRTYGSIGKAKTDSVGNSHAAEQFNYSPEVWLPRGNSNPSLQYDSITGLPPVL
ncbi:MAG TPA: hypothetical protein VFL85_03410 [Candidatus Saccharimonadales bacterium]|nr:hypothetical protein [Candidatus Saccharimonadales bacterium]